MLYGLQTMGCGRSKQQSPKNGEQDHGVNSAKEKGAGKKRKSKGDKKENKDPQKANDKAASSSSAATAATITTTTTEAKSSTPKKSSNTFLKPPPNTVNGASQQPNVLNLDVEYPSYKDKGDKGQGVKGKDLKEFSGKQTNIKVTNSQIEFFKMLDEKIEQGEDYGDYKSDASFEISTP